MTVCNTLQIWALKKDISKISLGYKKSPVKQGSDVMYVFLRTPNRVFCQLSWCLGETSACNIAASALAGFFLLLYTFCLIWLNFMLSLGRTRGHMVPQNSVMSQERWLCHCPHVRFLSWNLHLRVCSFLFLFYTRN